MSEHKNRIDYIDVARGITMLLVIAGHTFSNKLLIAVIYSVHMPLFFFLSAYAGNNPVSINEAHKKVIKMGKKLLLPAVGLYLVRYVLLCIKEHTNLNVHEVLMSILFSSGFDLPNSMAMGGTKSVGMVWFLVVLFTSRTIWNYLSLTRQSVVCVAAVLLSVAGVVVGRYQWLPFSFDVSLACIIYFLIGTSVKKKHTDKRTGSYLILIATAAMIYFVSVIASYKISGTFLNIAHRDYPLFPICTAISFIGIFLIVSLSKFIDRLNTKRIINWIGKHSMTVLSVHYMDMLGASVWMLSDNRLIRYLIRLALDIFIAVLISMCVDKYRALVKRQDS